MTAALEGGEWSAARPDRTLLPGKARYTFYRRPGGPQGRSGRAGKSRHHRDSIPDRPARSESLYRLSYRTHTRYKWEDNIKVVRWKEVGWIRLVQNAGPFEHGNEPVGCIKVGEILIHLWKYKVWKQGFCSSELVVFWTKHCPT